MEKKLPNSYPTDYILLIVQDFWQAHYQVFLITLLKEFIELNVNTEMVLNTLSTVELNPI